MIKKLFNYNEKTVDNLDTEEWNIEKLFILKDTILIEIEKQTKLSTNFLMIYTLLMALLGISISSLDLDRFILLPMVMFIVIFLYHLHLENKTNKLYNELRKIRIRIYQLENQEQNDK